MLNVQITDRVADELRSLIQLDYDAVQAYNQAIDGIDVKDAGIKAELAIFRDDHERHIRELSEVLRGCGYDTPELKRDVKGVLIEGMTAVRASLGTGQALKAMRQNEVITNKKYESALKMEEAPVELLTLISKNREDERRHLDYITRVLSSSAWEGTVANV